MIKTLILSLIICTTSIQAMCASPKIYIKHADTLAQNSLIYIEGYRCEKVIRSIGKLYTAILVHRKDTITLNVHQTYFGTYGLSLVTLGISDVLNIEKKYQFIIFDPLTKRTLVNDYPNLFSSNDKHDKIYSVPVKDTTSPLIKSKPKFHTSSFSGFGCGPSVYATFKLQIEDQSQIYVEAELVALDDSTSTTYLISYESDSIDVGHNMCSGGFNFNHDSEYKIRFKAYDIFGNTNDKWSDWITFRRPEPN